MLSNKVSVRLYCGTIEKIRNRWKSCEWLHFHFLFCKYYRTRITFADELMLIKLVIASSLKLL